MKFSSVTSLFLVAGAGSAAFIPLKSWKRDVAQEITCEVVKGSQSEEEERQLRAIFEGSSPEDGYGTYGEWLGEYARRLVTELAEAAGVAATATDPRFTTFLPSGEDSRLLGLMDIAPLYSCLMSSLSLTPGDGAMPFSLAGVLVSEMEELVSQVDVITREVPWNKNYTTNFDELDVRFLLGLASQAPNGIPSPVSYTTICEDVSVTRVYTIVETVGGCMYEGYITKDGHGVSSYTEPRTTINAFSYGDGNGNGNGNEGVPSGNTEVTLVQQPDTSEYIETPSAVAHQTPVEKGTSVATATEAVTIQTFDYETVTETSRIETTAVEVTHITETLEGAANTVTIPKVETAVVTKN